MKVPILPLSAVGFYLVLIILWQLHVIPSPKELVTILETLSQHYGYFGLVLATLLEGIAYICLYVPGAFIIALTVFFSDRSLISLVTISAIVSITLAAAACINYFMGRFLVNRKFPDKKDLVGESEMLSHGFILSMLHPNLLAFYFFNAGLEKRDLKNSIYVPLVMFPYGFIIAFLLSTFSSPIRHGLETPGVMITLLSIWFVVAFWKENRKRFLAIRLTR